jgi:hypothetical protein
VVWATIAVLATYAALQALAGSTMTSTLWWQSEWTRIRLHHEFPKASFTQPRPGPTWESWLPSATTAFVLILSLVILALVLVCAGRGWWLLLVAAIPLVPAQIAPGTWAPELSNQLMYAIVWPAGATEPTTAWCWVSAAIESLVIAVPALGLKAVVVERRQAVHISQVVRQLLPGAVIIAAVVGWNVSAGEVQDWTTLARRAVFAVIGALLFSGGVRRRRALPLLVLLPAFASGLVRWTTGVDGHAAVVTDWSVRGQSVAAVCGAAWILGYPAVARAVRSMRTSWVAMIDADEARRSARRELSLVKATEHEAIRADDEVSRPHRAAPAASGGRHRQ